MLRGFTSSCSPALPGGMRWQTKAGMTNQGWDGKSRQGLERTQAAQGYSEHYEPSVPLWRGWSPEGPLSNCRQGGLCLLHPLEICMPSLSLPQALLEPCLAILCFLPGGRAEAGCFFPDWKRQQSSPFCQISLERSSVSH